MKRAVNRSEQPDYLLIDAMKLRAEFRRNRGDAKSISIAAASIVAKVLDQMMKDYERLTSGYRFAQNAGYGTAHLEGLEIRSNTDSPHDFTSQNYQ